MQPDWPAEVHCELAAAGVRVVGYVPDAGHKRLIELCRADRKMRAVPLTTEEEGIGLACGAWLGGERSVLLMQSSGVGNLINVLSPEAVVIGGGLVEAMEKLYLEEVERAIEEHALEFMREGVELFPAKLGDDAVVMGAAALIADRLNGA